MGAALSSTAYLGVWVGVFILLGIVVGLNMFGVACARDSERSKLWAARMASDVELSSIPPSAWAASSVAKVIPSDAPLAARTPSAARVLPSGSSLSRDPVALRVWQLLESWSAAQQVVASSPLAAAVNRWRASVSSPRIESTLISSNAVLLSVLRARLVFGEPNTLVSALWSLCHVRRDYYVSASLSAPPMARLFGALAAVAASAFGTTVLYAYLLDVSTVAGSPAFAGLSGGQTFALAFASAFFFQVPVDAILNAYLRFRARVAVRLKYPMLADELSRRTRAALTLDSLPTSALVRISGVRDLSDDEEKAADEGAPPGFPVVIPSDSVASWFLSTFKRHPDDRARSVGAAADAARALGVENENVDDAELVSHVRSAVEAAPLESPPSIPIALAADAATIAFMVFCAVYLTSFSLARGPSATAAATGAWALAVFLSVLVVYPACIGARVALAFATRGALAYVAPLSAHHSLVAMPSAIAAAAGGAAPADVAIALIAPEVIAAAVFAASDGKARTTSVHVALRGAALASAYFAVFPAHVDASLALKDVVEDDAVSAREDVVSVYGTMSSAGMSDPSPPAARPNLNIPVSSRSPPVGIHAPLRIQPFETASDILGEVPARVPSATPRLLGAVPERGILSGAAKNALARGPTGLNLTPAPRLRPAVGLGPMPRPRPSWAASGPASHPPSGVRNASRPPSNLIVVPRPRLNITPRPFVAAAQNSLRE